MFVEIVELYVSSNQREVESMMMPVNMSGCAATCRPYRNDDRPRLMWYTPHTIFAMSIGHVDRVMLLIQTCHHLRYVVPVLTPGLSPYSLLAN